MQVLGYYALRSVSSFKVSLACGALSPMAGQQGNEPPADPRWPAFQARFSEALRTLAKYNKGCMHCQGNCQRQFAKDLLQLRAWRAEFHALPSAEAKDHELSWMFWHAAPGAGRADNNVHSAASARVDTSSSGEEPVPNRAEPAASSAQQAGCRAAAAKAQAKVAQAKDAKDPKAPPKAKDAKHKAQAKAAKAKAAKAQAAKAQAAKATAETTARSRPCKLPPPRLDTSSSEASPPGRIDTSPSPSSDSDLDVVAVGAAAAAGPAAARPARTARRRLYNAGRPRQLTGGVKFLGKSVCFQAARALVGVGLKRLYRLKDGLTSGHSDLTIANKRAKKGPVSLRHNATKMPSVMQFLWELYHSVGEGMPDKFAFERPGLSSREQSSALLGVGPALAVLGARQAERKRNQTPRKATTRRPWWWTPLVLLVPVAERLALRPTTELRTATRALTLLPRLGSLSSRRRRRSGQ